MDDMTARKIISTITAASGVILIVIGFTVNMLIGLGIMTVTTGVILIIMAAAMSYTGKR